MIIFNISRKVLNFGLELVYPRWRPIVIMAGLGVINMILGFLDLLDAPNLNQAFLFCNMAVIPLIVTIVATIRLPGRHRLNEQIDNILKSFGLKSRLYSKTIVLYQGEIHNRKIVIFVDHQEPKRGIYFTPKPKSITANANIKIRMSAAHKGSMSLLPESTQITQLPPNVTKMSVDRGLLPGKVVLTLDELWSKYLLAIPAVITAIRNLSPESDPNRFHQVVIGGHAVVLETQFMGNHESGDPLISFVTTENIQQILDNLRVLAEAAENLPEPAVPEIEDKLARIVSIDPGVTSLLPGIFVLIMLSVGWSIARIVSLLRF